MWIVTADLMREIDRRTIEEHGVPGRELMERAGADVFALAQELHPARIAVLCGPGNNGGDGSVVARIAHDAGLLVDWFFACSASQLSPDARKVMEDAVESGLRPVFSNEPDWQLLESVLEDADVIIDALLGIGADRELTGHLLEAVEAINASDAPVLSVDVPSGIETDTGAELGAAVRADVTLTFGAPKPCLFSGEGLEAAGEWRLSDIGFAPQLMDQPTEAFLLDPFEIIEFLPFRTSGSHKGDNGHLLIIAGSDRMRGAAQLVARAALRAGAGLVTVASVESVCAAVSVALPEALILPLPARDGVIAPEALSLLLSAAENADAAVFGPGMTHDASVLELLRNLWPQWTRPAVIDADALNAIATGIPLPPTSLVLTPHPGEMARLMDCSVAEVQGDRFRTVKDAALRFGHTVLLKGRHSLVSDAEAPVLVNNTGNPGLATGGTGDVLSGVIGALLAQGQLTRDAAACGMFWHGLAADLCASDIGLIGYTASEVANRLPEARATIMNTCESNLQ